MARTEEEFGIETPHAVKRVTVTRPEIGISAVAIHWGRKLVQTPQALASTGFPALYQSDFNRPRTQRRDDVVALAGQAIRKVAELQGWYPRDIGRLHLACSNPWDDKYFTDIMESAGLSHLKWETDVTVTSLACNSGARAIQTSLTENLSTPVPTITAAVEDLTGPFDDPKATDDLSLGIFSNALAVIGYVPGEGLTHVRGTDLIIYPDTKGALAASVSYPYVLEEVPQPGQYLRRKNYELMVMPRPQSPGKVLEMKGMSTLKLFVNLVAAHAPHFLNSPDFPEVLAWVMHQPAIQPYRAISERFPQLGLRWLYLDGNNSAATTSVAFTEQLEEFEPGSNVGILGFGGGATMTMEVAKLGAK